MSTGFLIHISYKVLGVSKATTMPVDSSAAPDSTTAATAATTAYTAWRVAHGETLTNVVTLLSGTW